MNKFYPLLLALVIVAYCTWQGADLFTDWFNFPFMMLSWFAFVVWVFPIFAYWCFPSQATKHTTPWLFWLALTASVIGTLGTLHALQYIGFMLALMALLPVWGVYSLIWILSAATWMPAASYFASVHSLPVVVFGRVVIAFIGAFAILIPIYKQVRNEKK